MTDSVSVTSAVTIDAAPERVFSFWTDLENFHSFIPALAAVNVIDAHHSRWVVRAPLDYEISFDSVIVEQVPPERLVWETRHEAGNARGELNFTRDGSRTRVELVFRYALYRPWQQGIARLLHRIGFPARELDHGLEQIKNQIESRIRRV